MNLNTNQLDLFGFQVPYQCKKCKKCFTTMKESSKHYANFHKSKSITSISINFALENYCLVSTKEVLEIERCC